MENAVNGRTALLQALLFGEGYGLDLIERVKTLTAGRVQLGQGTVYPLLRDMEGEGLLDSRDGEPMAERGGRPRRYYKLTESGVRAATVERAEIGGLFGVEKKGDSK